MSNVKKIALYSTTAVGCNVVAKTEPQNQYVFIAPKYTN